MATDISSSDEEVRQAGIKLLTGAIEVHHTLPQSQIAATHTLPAVLLPVESRQAGLAMCCSRKSSRWEVWRFLAGLRVSLMQALNTAGGQHFVGVNFGAMDKYRKPLSAEQWKTCAKSLKVPSSCTSCLHMLWQAELPVCHPAAQSTLWNSHVCLQNLNAGP